MKNVYIFLLFITGTLVCSWPATAQLPYSSSFTNQAKEALSRAEHAYAGTGRFEKETVPVIRIQRGLDRLAEFIADNRRALSKSPTVYNLMQAYAASSGAIGGKDPAFCHYLQLSRQAFLKWQNNTTDGPLQLQWFSETFGITAATYDGLYASPYATQHEVTPDVECCFLDTDRDRIPDCMDQCPDKRGKSDCDGCPAPCSTPIPLPSAPSRPTLSDTDGDGVADKFDLCPKIPGPLERRGCPLQAVGPNDCIREIVLMNGVICITMTDARFIPNDGSTYTSFRSIDLLLIDQLAKGAFNSEGILLSDAKGTPLHEEMAGSSFVLAYLEYLDANKRKSMLFQPAAYTVDAETYPEFYDESGKAYSGIIRAVKILTDTLRLPTHGWRLLVQGSADKPEIGTADGTKPLERPLHEKMLHETIFYRYDGLTETFNTVDFSVLPRGRYNNDLLPNCRGGWMYDQFIRSLDLAAYSDNILAIDGKVIDVVNPEKRNATAYLAIDRYILKEYAERFEAKARSEFMLDPTVKIK